MHTKFLSLFSLLIFPLLLSAQNPPPASPYSTQRSEVAVLGIENELMIDQLMVYIPGIGSPSREALTRQNIKPYMMPIRQMTDTRNEWAYALTACLEYYVNLNNNFKDNLSPDYISLSLAAAGSRPNLIDGLSFLVQQGTVSAAIVNYGSEVIPRSVFNVPRYQISNFAYLFRPTTRGRNRIFELRKALSRGNPVIVEYRTGADFQQWRNGTYSTTLPRSETHYLTIVGYDEDAETFELRTSNGRHWGNSGYVTVSYNDIAEFAQNAFVIIPRQ